MNKTIKILIGVIAAIVLVTAGYFLYNGYIRNDKSQQTAAEVYTCPMHPQIISDRPGTCPICGMDLVKKSDVSKDESQTSHDLGNVDVNEVKLSPSQQVLANVQTHKVSLRQFSGEKTYNGIVKINEKREYHISTPVSGKIVNMFVTFEGQYVRKGQPVVEIYSPDIVSTQKEYLLALRNLNQVKASGSITAIEQAQSLVNASRDRLLLWEVTPGQIDELERTQAVKNTIIQYSKYSGIVTKRFLNIGHWPMMGQEIYELADLTTVWVVANVYENDIQFIKSGQTAEISSGAYPGESFTAKINFIEPIFDAATRTQQVRMDVSNRNNKLKPDMYVKIKVNTFYDQLLAVPKNAVIRKGESDVVYVEKSKGVYVPRTVKIAFEQDGYYAITEGLAQDDIVVVSGGFLVDSESQIQAGMTSGHEQHKSTNPKNEEELKINPDQDIMKDMEKKKTEEHEH